MAKHHSINSIEHLIKQKLNDNPLNRMKKLRLFTSILVILFLVLSFLHIDFYGRRFFLVLLLILTIVDTAYDYNSKK